MAQARGLFGGTLTFDHRSQQWVTFEVRFKQYCIANRINDESDQTYDIRRAILLTSLAEETFAIAANLVHPNSLDKIGYPELINLLSAHFTTKRCVFAERYNFYRAEQKPGESLNEWAVRVRNLAKYCNFREEFETVTRDRFLLGLENAKERERLFTEDEKKMTFNKALELAQAVRCARVVVRRDAAGGSGAGGAGGPADELFAISRADDVKKRAMSGKVNSSSEDKKACEVCGYTNHVKEKCRFKNYKCKKCGEKGHLSRMCSNKETVKQSNYLAEGVTCEMEGNLDFYNLKDPASSPILLVVDLGRRSIDCEIDSGSSVSAMSEAFYNKHFKQYNLIKKDILLRTYDGGQITPLGLITLPVTYCTIKKYVTFYIIQYKGLSPPKPILGRDFMTSFSLTLCNLHYVTENLDEVGEISRLKQKYSTLFLDKLGKFNKFEVDLTLQPGAKPIFVKPRPVPFALKSKVDEALDKLVDADVLEPISHSDFATPIIPVLKPDGSVRICEDYSVTLNKILVIDQYPLPRIQELFAKLHNGEEFTKLNLSMAYWQLCLSEESQRLTCINTHRGLYKFKRLVLGISPAPAIFQKTMERVLAGIEGVCIFQDDLLITAPDRNTHVNRLNVVLKRLQDSGFTLKKEKCYFLQKSVEYLGYVIDKQGIHTSPDKVRAIKEALPPSNVSQLKSFLGLVNYYRIFVPNMSTLLAPLHLLLKKGVKWDWKQEQQRAFEIIKSEMQSDRILAHFNPDLKTILTVDASPHGLGAILSQVQKNGSEKVISYASRSLSKSEYAYSHIHKEATAIIFGVKRYHQYLYGRSTPFVLRTDHKPLLSIFGSKKGIPEMAANRLQRYALFLTAYNYVIEYVRGGDNTADYLSRSLAPSQSILICDSKDCEPNSYMHFIMSDDSNLPVSLNDIKKQTQRDKILMQVVSFVQTGWPKKVTNEYLKPYYSCRMQITYENECLMRGHKVIIPNSLREKVLNELHSSHFGVVKTKSEARSRLWWPGIDKDIEEKIGSCELCFDTKQAPPRAPLAPWPAPSRPWERVHIDLLTIQGKNYLIIIDAFSKWLECHVLLSATNSEAIIGKLSDVIGRFGLMKIIVSDNASNFTSELFERFCATNGIKHLTIAPYHPASNGQAENSVKTIKRAITTLSKECSSQFLLLVKLNKFLLDYRNTAHCSTGFSPAQLMFGRPLRTRLDLLCNSSDKNLPSTSQIHQTTKTNLLNKQISQCKDYDGKRVIKFRVGDEVLIKKHYLNGTKHTWIRGKIGRKIGSRMFIVYVPTMGQSVKKHADQMLHYKGASSEQPPNLQSNHYEPDYSYVTINDSETVSETSEQPQDRDSQTAGPVVDTSEDTDEHSKSTDCFESPLSQRTVVSNQSYVSVPSSPSGEESACEPSSDKEEDPLYRNVTLRPHNRR